jgi:hypothetical protein
MPENALVRVVREGTTHAGDLLRAQADVLAVERLVAEALALTTATDMSRARLRAIVRAVDVLVAPWRMTFPAKALVDWHEGIRRALYIHAIKLVGAATAHHLAPPPVEALGPGSAVLLSGARSSPRSMFGLR